MWNLSMPTMLTLPSFLFIISKSHMVEISYFLFLMFADYIVHLRADKYTF